MQRMRRCAYISYSPQFRLCIYARRIFHDFTAAMHRRVSARLSRSPLPCFPFHGLSVYYKWLDPDQQTMHIFLIFLFSFYFIIFIFFLLLHFHPFFFYLVIKICIYIFFRLLLCLVFSLASAAGTLEEGGRRNKKYKQSITRLIAKREREQSYSVGQHH